MRAAYDALDDRTKSEIADLVCRHSNMYSRGKLGLAEFSDDERAIFKPVRQRLVGRHPISDRKSLFLSAHAGEIEGMKLRQARMLLLDLTEFATQERFVYSHVWRVNNLVMWDNRSTMHHGRRFDSNEVRDIRQTRLAGDGPTIAQDPGCADCHRSNHGARTGVPGWTISIPGSPHRGRTGRGKIV